MPLGRGQPRRHRRHLTATVAQLLGVAVSVAVPVQRVDPRVVLAVSAVEIAAFAAAVLTFSPIAWGVTALAGVALVGLRVGDRRHILAVTPDGVVDVVATAGGRPVAAVGSGPARLAFPAPVGLGVPIMVGSHRWWIDRSEFARLRRARELDGAFGEQR